MSKPIALGEPKSTPDAKVGSELAELGLLYVSDAAPGITRRRVGKGFSYRDAAGRTLRDKDTLAWIRSLAIPPGVATCLDLAAPSWPLAGHRARCPGPQAISLSSALAQPA